MVSVRCESGDQPQRGIGPQDLPDEVVRGRGEVGLAAALNVSAATATKSPVVMAYRARLMVTCFVSFGQAAKVPRGAACRYGVITPTFGR
jgi:hypothetical protein